MVFEPPQPPQSQGGWQPTPAEPPQPAWSPAAVPLADLRPPAPPARHRGRSIAALVVAIVAIVIAGAATLVATSGGAKQSPLAVLTAASGKTTAAGTAHVSTSETITIGDRSLQVLTVTGDTSWAGKTSAMTMSSRGRDVLEIRQVAKRTYMSSPFVALPGRAHWVVIEPGDLKLGADTAALGNNDPSAGLRYLSAINGHPKALGTATIDGVDTTHYAFTVDLKSFMDQIAKAQQQLGGSAANLGALNGLVDLTKLPAQAWIDHDGRVRRFELTISVSAEGQTEKVVDVTSFSQFDAPVNVSAPAGSDTVSFSQFPQFMSRLGSGTAAGLSS